MDQQNSMLPTPDPLQPQDIDSAGASSPPSPPPQKKDSFIMSFIPKKDFSKFLPVVLILFLVAALPLTLVLVRQRQLSESQASLIGCACESVTADRDLNNLNVGDVVKFTGFGKTNHPQAIGKIKFIISKDGTVVIAEEVPDPIVDREEGGWRFYKADFSYTVEDYGDYEVAIQISCPDGWKD